MSFVKARANAPRINFREQADRAKQAATRGDRETREHWHDWFSPGEDGQWFALCDQRWTSTVYDKRAKQVVTWEDQFYFAWTRHYCHKTRATFVCSGGAHKDQPCWGCAIQRDFHERRRAHEKATGIRSADEAPVKEDVRNAVSGVLLENIVTLPMTDNSGAPRKNKKGEVIYQETLLSKYPPAERKVFKDGGKVKFGALRHWSMSPTQMQVFAGFDDQLRDRCGSCTGNLYAPQVNCPECGTTRDRDDDGDPLESHSLSTVRELDLPCRCGHYGPMTPIISCRTCSDPIEGGLMMFALKIVRKKTGDKTYDLKFTEIASLDRIIAKHPHVAKMLDEPLALNKVFMPHSIGQQEAWAIPKEYQAGLSAEPRAKNGGMSAEPLTTAYSFGGVPNSTFGDGASDAVDEPADYEADEDDIPF